MLSPSSVKTVWIARSRRQARRGLRVLECHRGRLLCWSVRRQCPTCAFPSGEDGCRSEERRQPAALVGFGASELGPLVPRSGRPSRGACGCCRSSAGSSGFRSATRASGSRARRSCRRGWDYSRGHRADGADDGRRGDGRPDRVRRHRDRARRADGDRDVLGAVHAALVPGQRPQGDARGPRGHARVLVRAAAADRRGSPRPRRHARRIPARGRARALPGLPRPLPASPAAGQGGVARRPLRTRSAPRDGRAREHPATLRRPMPSSRRSSPGRRRSSSGARSRARSRRSTTRGCSPGRPATTPSS